jgi:hypothetical protein
MATPITNYIHMQFERVMTAHVNASDFRWEAGYWPVHFYIQGRPKPFYYFSSIRKHGKLDAKVYRDSLGFEIIVDNQ